MHARPAPATVGIRHVAGAAFRGAAGFMLFIAIAGLVGLALLIGGLVAVAAILSHLPADTLPR